MHTNGWVRMHEHTHAEGGGGRTTPSALCYESADAGPARNGGATRDDACDSATAKCVTMSSLAHA